MHHSPRPLSIIRHVSSPPFTSLSLSLSLSGQMRYTKSPTEVWPSQPENFKEVALEYYDLMLRITKGIPLPVQTELFLLLLHD
jgi:hypothetical protein